MRRTALLLGYIACAPTAHGEEALVLKIGRAIDKAEACGFLLNRERAIEVLKGIAEPMATPVATSDEVSKNIIEEPAPDQDLSTAEPSPPPIDMVEPADLGCDRLLDEFGPEGVLVAGLIVPPADAPVVRQDSQLPPAARVRTIKVRPDGTFVDD